MRTALVIPLLFLAACAHRDEPRKLSIAAAADLNFALERISRGFRGDNPRVDVVIAYGSSGNFYQQIRNGAPFDIFLSADVEYPRRLAAAGLAKAGSEFVYGAGRIVVWVPAQSPLEPATALRNPSLAHLAIANPQHAPYGRAAEAALRSLGVYDAVASKLVLGENIAQTLQFVQSGSAGAGIVALSLALAPPVRQQGRYWEIPAAAYPPIEQGGIILRDSGTARAFRDYLLSEHGRAVLKEFGFSLPGA